MNIKTTEWKEKEIWKGKFNFGIGNAEVPIYIPLFIHRSAI